ncbi:MAG: LCP family protein [Chloroflexota bacterium]|nr:LCP family protein [Chloroflexota bacterium]
MKLIDKSKENFPKDRFTQIVLALMVILALVGAFVGYRYARKFVSTNETFSLPGDPVVENDDELDSNGDEDNTNTAKPTEIAAADLPTPEPWDGVSRINLLVMGLDYRDWEAGETPRTDTMIVLTLDPLNNTAGMISIPRDLWVTIPGFESGKINTAYYLGEVYNLPGGGPGLAASTVEELLGVPIHYYAQIDFQAFVDFIDHIEGVRLTFDEPMVLDRLGKWNTVTIEPGVITLPGEYALAYVRARKTEGGDFDRAERQQKLIMAIRDRILEFDMMPKLVAKAPEIYNDLAAGIRTNMNLNEAIKLGWSVLAVDRDEISQVVISNEYVSLGKSPDGLDILMPVPDKVRLLRDEIFADGAALGPVAEGDLLELVAEEGARFSVRNGSSQSDLAIRTAAWFREQGINVVEEVNTDYNLITRVYIYSGTPYALNWLSETMGITSNNIIKDDDAGGEIDIIVVLGDDWAAQNPMP